MSAQIPIHRNQDKNNTLCIWNNIVADHEGVGGVHRLSMIVRRGIWRELGIPHNIFPKYDRNENISPPECAFFEFILLFYGGPTGGLLDDRKGGLEVGTWDKKGDVLPLYLLE